MSSVDAELIDTLIDRIDGYRANGLPVPTALWVGDETVDALARHAGIDPATVTTFQFMGISCERAWTEATR